MLQLRGDRVAQASSRKDKVTALLTALQKNWKDEYMHRLCVVLVEVACVVLRKCMCVVLESANTWLLDELNTELECENGKQVISEAIDLENGRIVFKEFGNERRLSELEKKRLHALLNRKSQCTRDIWQTDFTVHSRDFSLLEQETGKIAREDKVDTEVVFTVHSRDLQPIRTWNKNDCSRLESQHKIQ